MSDEDNRQMSDILDAVRLFATEKGRRATAITIRVEEDDFAAAAEVIVGGRAGEVGIFEPRTCVANGKAWCQAGGYWGGLPAEGPGLHVTIVTDHRPLVALEDP